MYYGAMEARNMADTHRVITKSLDYGIETFDYESLVEAEAGIKRLKASAERLKDGVQRYYSIEPIEDEE